MSHALAIAGRELRSIFSTPVAYIMFAAYLFFCGFIFFLALVGFLNTLQQIQMYQMHHMLDDFNLNQSVIEPALGMFSIVFILLIPLLTMRLFAEERSNGTIELLLTSPVRIGEIVVGKFLAMLVVLGILVGLSALYPALLFFYGDPEFLQTLAGLIGLFLYGMAFAAIGCFISAIVPGQIAAAVVTFIVGLVLFLVDFLAEVGLTGVAQSVVRYMGLRAHFDQLLSGVVQTDDLVYFVIVTLFFLAGVRAVLESLRWR